MVLTGRGVITADKPGVTTARRFGIPEQTFRTLRQGARLVVSGSNGLLMQYAMQDVFGQLRKG